LSSHSNFDSRWQIFKSSELMSIAQLLSIYAPLIGWTGLGWLLGRVLPTTVLPYLGKFLFWIGVPLGILAFLRHAQVSWSLWMAPAIAWVALFSGAGLARLYLRWAPQAWLPRTQTSFLLASMVGNTGYIGFPVSLSLVGPQYFAWAVFYDMLGSTPGAYGLGVALAAQTQHTTGHQASIPPVTRRALIKTMAINPAFWSFAVGLMVRDVPLPVGLEMGLKAIAWVVISLALILVGMRLSQLSSFKGVQPALISLSIKMLIVPLVVGSVLQGLGLTGNLLRAVVLQTAMPPAFATLVIAEAYALDQDLAVTAIALGSLLLLLTLPLWLWLFPA
jgi:predicted permease